MKLTLQHAGELSSEWEVARQQVQADLERIAIAVNSGWSKEHNPDGTHAAVTADTLSLQGALVGVPVDLPYDATRYRPYGAGLWTVGSTDHIYLRYARIGQLAWVEFWLQETALDTINEELYIRLPELHPLRAQVDAGAAFGANHTCGVFNWVDIAAGTEGMGFLVSVTVNTNGFQTAQLHLVKSDYANFAVTTNLMVRGSCMFPLNANNIAIPF